jgi:hypothetical protein
MTDRDAARDAAGNHHYVDGAEVRADPAVTTTVAPAADDYAITFGGDCPGCGCTVTASAQGCTDLVNPQTGETWTLGAPFDLACLCGAAVPARCVGLSIEPWRCEAPADEDEDDDA